MTYQIPEELLSRLRQRCHIAVLTGAGVSAESGVPTFREAASGLWSSFRPEDLATPQAFRENPRQVWEWYAWRRSQVSQVEPNPGHYALARMEAHASRFTLITQNVDGLHQRAGSRNVVELHGNILRTRCSQENILVETWDEGDHVPPICPRCGGLLRPDVVWFGEVLNSACLQAAFDAAHDCDVFISAGTSAVVEPAASLPYLARQHGALIVEVNPEETPLTPYAHVVMRGNSGVELPHLVASAWKQEALS